MTWILWVIVVWLCAGSLLSVLVIGEERRPLTPGTALLGILVNWAIAAAIVFVGIL